MEWWPLGYFIIFLQRHRFASHRIDTTVRRLLAAAMKMMMMMMWAHFKIFISFLLLFYNIRWAHSITTIDLCACSCRWDSYTRMIMGISSLSLFLSLSILNIIDILYDLSMGEDGSHRWFDSIDHYNSFFFHYRCCCCCCLGWWMEMREKDNRVKRKKYATHSMLYEFTVWNFCDVRWQKSIIIICRNRKKKF